MFDNASSGDSRSATRAGRRRVGPEDERIALRCNRKELQLVDSFVSNGEFASRSEIRREALREFLRARAMPAVAAAASQGLVEVRVPLRAEEVETYRAYGELIANGRSLEDVAAELLRRGDLELKVSELVARARAAVRQAAETRAQIDGLQRAGAELERRGLLGR